jgi:hypothetical protein
MSNSRDLRSEDNVLPDDYSRAAVSRQRQQERVSSIHSLLNADETSAECSQSMSHPNSVCINMPRQSFATGPSIDSQPGPSSHAYPPAQDIMYQSRHDREMGPSLIDAAYGQESAVRQEHDKSLPSSMSATVPSQTPIEWEAYPHEPRHQLAYGFQQPHHTSESQQQPRATQTQLLEPQNAEVQNPHGPFVLDESMADSGVHHEEKQPRKRTWNHVKHADGFVSYQPNTTKPRRGTNRSKNTQSIGTTDPPHAPPHTPFRPWSIQDRLRGRHLNHTWNCCYCKSKLGKISCVPNSDEVCAYQHHGQSEPCDHKKCMDCT